MTIFTFACLIIIGWLYSSIFLNCSGRPFLIFVLAGVLIFGLAIVLIFGLAGFLIFGLAAVTVIGLASFLY